LSACEVDEVAAIAAGVTGFRAATAACWRVAGPRAGAGAAGAGAVVAGAAVTGVDGFGAAEVAGATAAVVLGTTLRAIGRGFGRGTFGLAQTSVATASPTANARYVASAVDRNAAVWTVRITAFPDDESLDLTSSRSI
jgi:hypothetical protein